MKTHCGCTRLGCCTPYVETLFGRPIDDWMNIHDVMHLHGIKDAKSLDRALKPGLVRTPVVDRKNPARVLGFLTKRFDFNGTMLCVAAMSRVHVDWKPVGVPNTVDASISHVHFERDYVSRDGGYTQELRFLTETPLGVLQMLPDFILPGETERQREMRLHYRA